MANKNVYKQRLATASLEEARAMDNAYTQAASKGVKEYDYKGLKYAVTGGARTYAENIVKNRIKDSTSKPASTNPVSNTSVRTETKTPTTTTSKNVSNYTPPKFSVPDVNIKSNFNPTLGKSSGMFANAKNIEPKGSKYEVPTYDTPSTKLNTTPIKKNTNTGLFTEDRRISTVEIAKDKPKQPLQVVERKVPRLEIDTSHPDYKKNTEAYAKVLREDKPQVNTTKVDTTKTIIAKDKEYLKNKKIEEASLGSAINQTFTLAKNFAERQYYKSVGDGKETITDIKGNPTLNIAAPPDYKDKQNGTKTFLRDLQPAIATGDTINDEGSYYHLPEVINLTKVKAGARDRGDRTPVKSDGLILSAFDKNRLMNRKHKEFSDDKTYVGVGKDGSIKAGRGKDFGDDAQLLPFNMHEGVRGFSKDKNGNYVLEDADNAANGHSVPVLDRGELGNKSINLLMKDNDPLKTKTYGNITGGRAIFTSPDMKHQVLLSGSVETMEKQLAKFKEDYGLETVNYIMLDNGSYSRGMRDKDRHLDAKDWEAFDSRNTSGGSGFYLQGDGMTKYAYGGNIKKNPKYFLGGAFSAEAVGTETTNANMGAGLQFGAQAIQMIDGANGGVSRGGSIASSAMSGASMGAALGPWGAAAGAVAGGAAGMIAANAADKAERKAHANFMKGRTEQAEAVSKQVLRNYPSQGVASTGSYAYGGNVPQPEYEVEGNEVVQGQGVQLEGQQQLASDMHAAVGPTHEGGGVDGAGGDRVFSDRIKSSTGKTYAVAAQQLGKQKGKYEAKLESNDPAAKFSANRMIERIDNQVDNLFNEQEMKKKLATPQSLSSSSSSTGAPKFFYGGETDPARKNPYGPTGAYGALEPGWFMDKRSNLPANMTNNANGQYNAAESNEAHTNGLYLAPGQRGLHGVNNFKYAVKENIKDGSLYAANAGDDGSLKTITPKLNITQPKTAFSNPQKIEVKMAPPADYSNPKKTGRGFGQGVGFAGQYIDNFANALATANTPEIARPYLDPNVKLNTEFDIRPQLDSARRNKDAMATSIDANTVSSGSANANKQKLAATYNENANGLYAQKNNVEGQLKNQEILTNHRINSGNNDKRYAYDVAKTQRRAGIASDYAANAANFGSDLYTSHMDNKKMANDTEIAKIISKTAPDNATYFHDTEMFARIAATDKKSAMVAYQNMLKNQPNNPALATYKQILGI